MTQNRRRPLLAVPHPVPSAERSASTPFAAARDAYVWLFALALVAAAALAILADEADPLLAWTDLPFLVLATAAVDRRRRASHGERARRFWGLWTAGLGCWTAAGLLSLAVPDGWKGNVPFNLATDLCYVGLYLAIALAVEVAPHRPDARSAVRSIRRALSAGAVVFVFGMLVYFAVLPSTFAPDDYGTWIPSLLLYVALDVYVLARLVRVRQVCREPGWRAVYGVLALVAAVWVLTDGWDLLAPLGTLSAAPQLARTLATPLALAGLLAAARRPAADPPPPARDTDPRLSERWAGVLIAYAVAFPAVHAALHGLELVDASLRTPRELWVVAMLVLLALLSWRYQRRIQADVVRLETRQRAVDQGLELSQRMEAVGRLAGGIAHDFNNTLQVIGTHADVLRRDLRDSGGQDSDALRSHSTAIRRAVARAGRLTDQLLTLSRKRHVVPETFDLGEIPRHLATLARQVAGERIEVGVTDVDEPLWVYADRSQLEHAAVNLLLNARDATPDGGRITLGARRDGTAAVLSVGDTGSGMDDAVRARIFEPFYTTKSEKGTGLGLSMVEGIVTQCGGEVRVETSPDAGSRFDLVFPRVDPPPPEPAAAKPDPSATGGDRSVLVVEDNLPILSVVSLHLSSSGYDVRTAVDARSALDHLDERPADVVLLDVVMPGLGGPALVERILEQHPATRAVLMSGYAESSLQGLDGPLAAVPLLRKPFTTDQLDEVLRRVLADGDRRARPVVREGT